MLIVRQQQLGQNRVERRSLIAGGNRNLGRRIAIKEIVKMQFGRGGEIFIVNRTDRLSLPGPIELGAM